MKNTSSVRYIAHFQHLVYLHSVVRVDAVTHSSEPHPAG